MCPRSVDNKILTFMHNNKVYNPESQDVKVISLIGQLREGALELEGLKNFHTIEEKVLERIHSLAGDLHKNGFIVGSVQSSGQYCQAEEFRHCWENKEKHWRDCATHSIGTTEAESARPETATISSTIDPSGSTDDGLFVGPTAPTPPPAAKDMTNKAIRTVCHSKSSLKLSTDFYYQKPTTPKSSKRTASNADADYPTPPTTKRAKTARPSGLSGEVSERIFPKAVDKGKQAEPQTLENDDIQEAGPSKVPGMGSGSIFPKKSIEKEKELEPQLDDDENMPDAETVEHIDFAKVSDTFDPKTSIRNRELTGFRTSSMLQSALIILPPLDRPHHLRPTRWGISP
jgi:hypothetical protein